MKALLSADSGFGKLTQSAIDEDERLIITALPTASIGD
jgi:hypothetical protein